MSTESTIESGSRRFAGAAGSETDAKIRECGEWLVECMRQCQRGKPVLALGAVKCLQMSIEELAGMLGQPESPNSGLSDSSPPSKSQ